MRIDYEKQDKPSIVRIDPVDVAIHNLLEEIKKAEKPAEKTKVDETTKEYALIDKLTMQVLKLNHKVKKLERELFQSDYVRRINRAIEAIDSQVKS